MGGRLWTQEEMIYLEQIMSSYHIKEVAEMMDRSVYSVKQKIKQIEEKK